MHVHKCSYYVVLFVSDYIYMCMLSHYISKFWAGPLICLHKSQQNTILRHLLLQSSYYSPQSQHVNRGNSANGSGARQRPSSAQSNREPISSVETRV